MDVQVTVSLNGIEDKLNAIGPLLAKRYLRAALKAGAKVIEEEAKTRAPVDSGDLRDSITTVVKMSGKNESGRASVGPAYDTQLSKQGKDTSQDPGVYGKWVELGLDSREYPRNPFLRPALDSKAQEAVEKFAEVLRDGLNEVAK